MVAAESAGVGAGLVMTATSSRAGGHAGQGVGPAATRSNVAARRPTRPQAPPAGLDAERQPPAGLRPAQHAVDSSMVSPAVPNGFRSCLGLLAAGGRAARTERRQPRPPQSGCAEAGGGTRWAAACSPAITSVGRASGSWRRDGPGGGGGPRLGVVGGGPGVVRAAGALPAWAGCAGDRTLAGPITKPARATRT